MYQRVLRKGFPHQSLKKHYESAEVIKKFEDIRQHLLREGEDPTITNKILASIIYDLIVFQEKYLGIEVCNFACNSSRYLPFGRIFCV